MNIVKIKGIELGKGSPKICVPVTGRTKEEIRLHLEELQKAEPDLAEWRADWYEGVFDREKLEDELAFLRRELGNMPLLVTFRTKEEGGEQEISREAYEKFLRQVISSGHADLIDVELFRGEELLAEICREAHQAGVKAVASSHDFNGTPEKEEMIRRLCRMQECGADLLKLAVMPQNPGDVLELLSATWEMKERYAEQPLITMSMGGTGLVSRLAGEIFGSALTFGSAGAASAPGQIGVGELKAALALFHENRVSA